MTVMQVMTVPICEAVKICSDSVTIVRVCITIRPCSKVWWKSERCEKPLDSDHDIVRDCRQSKFMVAVWTQQHEQCVPMLAWRTVRVSQSEKLLSAFVVGSAVVR